MTLTQEYRLLWGWIDPSGLVASALEQGVAEEETHDETAAARGRERGRSVAAADVPSPPRPDQISCIKYVWSIHGVNSEITTHINAGKMCVRLWHNSSTPTLIGTLLNIFRWCVIERKTPLPFTEPPWVCGRAEIRIPFILLFNLLSVFLIFSLSQKYTCYQHFFNSP